MDPDGRSPIFLLGALGAFGGAMAHSDYANAPAQGEEPVTMSTFDHLGALPGLQSAKGAKFLGMTDADAAKVTKKVAPENAQKYESSTLSRKLNAEPFQADLQRCLPHITGWLGMQAGSKRIIQ